MIYGYARISTAGQDLAGQVEALNAASCAEIVTEIGSGAQGRRRPRLNALLQRLAPGDVLTVTGLDRVARSARDALNIIEAVSGRGAAFRSLREPWADMTTPAGRLMVTMLSGLAEFEREMILARTAAGRASARARGVKLGPPFKLTAAQRRYILDERAKANGATLGQLVRVTGASRSTISRFLRAAAKGEALEIEPPAPPAAQLDIEDAISATPAAPGGRKPKPAGEGRPK